MSESIRGTRAFYFGYPELPEGVSNWGWAYPAPELHGEARVFVSDSDPEGFGYYVLEEELEFRRAA